MTTTLEQEWAAFFDGKRAWVANGARHGWHVTGPESASFFRKDHRAAVVYLLGGLAAVTGGGTHSTLAAAIQEAESRLSASFVENPAPWDTFDEGTFALKGVGSVSAMEAIIMTTGERRAARSLIDAVAWVESKAAECRARSAGKAHPAWLDGMPSYVSPRDDDKVGWFRDVDAAVLLFRGKIYAHVARSTRGEDGYALRHTDGLPLFGPTIFATHTDAMQRAEELLYRSLVGLVPSVGDDVRATLSMLAKNPGKPVVGADGRVMGVSPTPDASQRFVKTGADVLGAAEASNATLRVYDDVQVYIGGKLLPAKDVSVTATDYGSSWVLSAAPSATRAVTLTPDTYGTSAKPAAKPAPPVSAAEWPQLAGPPQIVKLSTLAAIVAHALTLEATPKSALLFGQRKGPEWERWRRAVCDVRETAARNYVPPREGFMRACLERYVDLGGVA